MAYWGSFLPRRHMDDPATVPDTSPLHLRDFCFPTIRSKPSSRATYDPPRDPRKAVHRRTDTTLLGPLAWALLFLPRKTEVRALKLTKPPRRMKPIEPPLTVAFQTRSNARRSSSPTLVVAFSTSRNRPPRSSASSMVLIPSKDETDRTA